MVKKIMFVDDEADVREAVKAVLEGEGYEVVLADGGPTALKQLDKGLPDLALIDMFMPGMSGRELIEKIRDDPKLKDLKCAFLTVATFGKSGMEELKKLNILDYIQKPFDNADLVARVKKMVG